MTPEGTDGLMAGLTGRSYADVPCGMSGRRPRHALGWKQWSWARELENLRSRTNRRRGLDRRLLQELQLWLKFKVRTGVCWKVSLCCGDLALEVLSESCL